MPKPQAGLLHAFEHVWRRRQRLCGSERGKVTEVYPPTKYNRSIEDRPPHEALMPQAKLVGATPHGWQTCL